jgi:ubiquinone/menaquinone biosynthesis C-methylase UbiE
MNWHKRYSQQANWTRDLRAYLFDKAGLDRASRALEVGCGTGAILCGIKSPASLTCTAPNAVRCKCHGLDLDPAALAECGIHAPGVSLTRGDALALPYPDECFDVVFCHFLLLWVRDPLQAVREMRRVTRREGYVLALAEPDYASRVDKPGELAALGQWQMESLRRQGADPTFGARLAETFYRAGIELIETGTIQSPSGTRDANEREQEWEVLESDLAGIVPEEEIRKMKILDAEAWKQGMRVLHVPTYFALGKT